MTLANIDQQETGLTRAGLEHTKEQLQLLDDFVKDVLRENQDFGVIPGTDKPTLYKPGAANVIAAFNCHSEPFCEERTVDPAGKYASYEYHVDVIHNVTGKVMARGFGECNSHEVKYRYRDAKPTCPMCKAPAIFKSKFKEEFYCWAKQGGCNATFKIDDPAITSQSTGRIENEDPLDQTNTYMKMAIKRAEVDAALRLPGVARFFTQDLEDMRSTESATDNDAAEQPEPTPQPHPRRPNQKQPKTPEMTVEELQDWVSAQEMGWDFFVSAIVGEGHTWDEWVELGGTPAIAKTRWDKLPQDAPETAGDGPRQGE